MPHFNITVKGQRVGTVLQLGNQELYACFNKRFPQYNDVWGTPEQVRTSLKKQLPGAKYEPLSLPKVDAFCAFADGRITEAQFRPVWNGESDGIDGLQNI